MKIPTPLRLLAASLGVAVALVGLPTLVAAPAAAAPPATTQKAEGHAVPGTWAGNYTEGRTGFVGPCLNPGLPLARAKGAPFVTHALTEFEGQGLVVALRILNDKTLAPGNGNDVAAARWVALNQSLAGKAGARYNTLWRDVYGPHLDKTAPRVRGLVKQILERARKPLPTKTYEYASATSTSPAPGTQRLGGAGAYAILRNTCPTECKGEGLLISEASNNTRSALLFRAIKGAKVYGQMEVRPGQRAASGVRVPDGVQGLQWTVQVWGAGGYGKPRVIATMDIVCPMPPKVSVTLCATCEGLRATVTATNVSRYTQVVELTVAGAKVVHRIPANTANRRLFDARVANGTVIHTLAHTPGVAGIVVETEQVVSARVNGKPLLRAA